MKVLAIGNSFSQDATRYLYGISEVMPVKMKVVNLYIPGCPLRTHYINMLEDRKNYLLEFNGESTDFYVSIRDALISDTWDVVTLQQASVNSMNYSTFQPYLDELAAYVRKYCPTCKLYIHQTWAYEEGSRKLVINRGYPTEEAMLADILPSYEKAAEAVNAEGIIRSGEVMYALHKKIPAVHRDGSHAGLGAGRFALALTWYKTLTGEDVSELKFDKFDEAIPEEEYKAVIETVSEIARK